MNLNINIGRGIKGGGFVALLFLIPVLAIAIWTFSKRPGWALTSGGVG